MNRNQLARTVADAYFSQYVNDDGVMNDPIIVFDTDTKQFSWQSSLTPLGNDEIQVDELSDGMFGEVDTEQDLIEFLIQNDDYINSIESAIEENS